MFVATNTFMNRPPSGSKQEKDASAGEGDIIAEDVFRLTIPYVMVDYTNSK